MENFHRLKSEDYSFDIKMHRYINHYTDLSTIRCILKNHSFRLSRIDKVNDLLECERIDDFEKTKGFVGCFTQRSNESYFFWKAYSQHREGEVGVRITFPSELLKLNEYFFDSECLRPLESFTRTDYEHKSYSLETDWKLSRSFPYKIVYVDDVHQLEYVDTELKELLCDCINIEESFVRNSYPYLIKTKEWDQEEEVRLLAEVRPLGVETVLGRTAFVKNTYPQPPFEYIFLRTPQELLNKCIFTVSPFCTDKYEIVKDTITRAIEIDPSQIRNSCMSIRTE